jgi:hypothetical protein
MSQTSERIAQSEKSLDLCVWQTNQLEIKICGFFSNTQSLSIGFCLSAFSVSNVVFQNKRYSVIFCTFKWSKDV